jgi:hypothetical protein
MLRRLLVMPEQLGYPHHVCTRIMSALARFPELTRDADVRRAAARGRRAPWFEEVWPKGRTPEQTAATAGSTPSAISRARAGKIR